MSPLDVGLLVLALAVAGTSLGVLLRLLVERRWPQ